MSSNDILFIYLHGFSSGPRSNKAVKFGERFSELGIRLLIPDLEAGDFRNLSISSQVAVIRWLIHQNPAHRYGLIGSSMGGFLAALTAQLQPKVRAIYLMCPGFEFVKRWKKRLLDENRHWEQIPGLIPVLNYRYNKMMDFSTAIFDDAVRWEQVAFDRELPTRLVHGVHDDIVEIEHSREFVRNHPWARLEELDSDHGLLSHIDWILDDSVRFFQSAGLLTGS